ncbi:uncharacterized protein ACO6RY_05476 [Pungitius sinensis]
MRRTRRSSQTLLQDLVSRGFQGGNRDTPVPARPGRDARMVHSIGSLIGARSRLLLLEDPGTVEIYKLKDAAAGGGRARDDVYLPAIATRASSLGSARGSLSQSCSYLHDKRRGSFSSVASQRAGAPPLKKQSDLKAQREAKKSNVTVTMTYLGRGRRGPGPATSPRDELRVLQQVNGGENICVFKGSVTPGEQFQFVSQRHRGFPFSATLHVNGVAAARISSCCEYRYAPGSQQGRRGCFRLAWLAGGIPCYRCTSLRNKYGSCQQLHSGTKENLILPPGPSPGNGTVESCPLPPLFIPAKPEKKWSRRTRKHPGEGGGGGGGERSTDSEDPAAAAGIKEASKKKRRKGRANPAESRGEAAANERESGGRGGGASEASRRPTEAARPEGRRERRQRPERPRANAASKALDPLNDEEALTKQTQKLKQTELGSNGGKGDGGRLKDFYEECVAMSAALERASSKHTWLKANVAERRRLQRRLSSCPEGPASEVERSAESDTDPQHDGEPEEQEEQEEEEQEEQEEEAGQRAVSEEQDLQAQLDAMVTVLGASDEVEQLVLRNTGLTDDLLLSLAGALMTSTSEVTLLNLNLNLIGPRGARVLLDVLRAKPQVRGLHLFGNKLRDHGVLTLLDGVAELQEHTARAAAAAAQRAELLPPEPSGPPQLPAGWRSLRLFALSELDVGGNGLSGDGVKALASYMGRHSRLRYLGLAQTAAADLAAWRELFDSLRGSCSLTRIILDENDLGDPGVGLLADALAENASLREVDLDRNGVGDVGGNRIVGLLRCRTRCPLTRLSLQGNDISAGLMRRIQEEVKSTPGNLG